MLVLEKLRQLNLLEGSWPAPRSLEASARDRLSRIAGVAVVPVLLPAASVVVAKLPALFTPSEKVPTPADTWSAPAPPAVERVA